MSAGVKRGSSQKAVAASSSTGGSLGNNGASGDSGAGGAGSNATAVQGDDESASAMILIIDNGSYTIKAGLAGEDSPRISIPSMVLHTADRSVRSALRLCYFEGSGRSLVMKNSITPGQSQQQGQGKGVDVAEKQPFAGDGMPSEFVGHEARAALRYLESINIAGDMHVRRPWSRGDINHARDLKDMELLWRHVMKELAEFTEEPSVLVTVSPTTSADTREKVADFFLRTFRVHSLCIVNQAVMSLFASGRSMGLTLEIGHHMTNAVPIFQGYALQHALRSMPVAGADLTELLTETLNQRGVKVHSHAAEKFKEKYCTVRQRHDDHKGDEKTVGAIEAADGQLVAIENDLTTLLAEVLFNPQAVGMKGKGVQHLVHEAIETCDEYIRDLLYSNIVLAGGTSAFRGFGERLKAELQALVGPHQFVEVVMDSQRKTAAWVGGSMFASLPTYEQMRVTRKEFVESENGSIVHKKFF